MPNKRFRLLNIFSFIAILLLSACAMPQLPFKTALVPQGTPAGAPAPTMTAPAVLDDGTGQPAADNPTQPGEVSAFTPGGPPDSLSDVILFTSQANSPFAGNPTDDANLPYPERYLWAISSDGKRAGRLSPDGFGSAIFLPQRSGQKVRAVANGINLPGEIIDVVNPPDACGQAAGQPFDAANPPCGDFQFTLDGRALAFLSGLDSCGRTLTLIDLDTSKVKGTWQNVHWYQVLKNGSMVVSLGDCDKQVAYMVIPKTGSQSGIYRVGQAYWNPSHTAVVFQASGKDPFQSVLWGFNIETSSIFLWPAQGQTSEDTPVWLADGKHFVFQHRAYRYDETGKIVTLVGPRQVILMDAFTRAQKLLGYDGQNNYHLCPADVTGASAAGPTEPCAQTYGNFIQVSRAPFLPAYFPLAAFADKPEARCALDGTGCKETPELLAIQWKTGSTTAWEEAAVPTALTEIGTPQPPEQGDEPLFSDAGGKVSFYLGKDGRSLWRATGDQAPQLWINDGEGFVYLP